MKLSSLERRRVRDGNPLPIIRDTKPELELGAHVIVSWSRETRHWDKEIKKLFTVPAKPTLWITVTKITRRKVGGWAVRYDITDLREQAMFLAQKAGYTTDVLHAVDKGEVPLSEKDRQRISTEARATHAERQERSLEQRKRQERAHRAHLRDALDALSPVAQQLLLAALEREIQNARHEEAA